MFFQDQLTTTQLVVRAASNGSSGDEEVSDLLDRPQLSASSSNSSSLCHASSTNGYLATPTGAVTTPTPVQFCASPPLDVYRPRQSQSPPPKLFHLDEAIGHDDDGSRRGGVSFVPIGLTGGCKSHFPLSRSFTFLQLSSHGVFACNSNDMQILSCERAN